MSHKIKEIDDYIAGFEGEIAARMKQMRTLIHECSPNITERFSWKMPTFYLNGNLVHFAGSKNHLGFYPGPEGIEAFAHRFDEYKFKYSKGAVQFPYSKPMPWDLIREIVEFRVKQMEK